MALPRLKLLLLSEESGYTLWWTKAGKLKPSVNGMIQQHTSTPPFLDGYIRFESVLYPGKYLLVEEMDNVMQLTAGVPIDSEGSGLDKYSIHEWEQIFLSDPVKSAFKVTGLNGTVCLLALHGRVWWSCRPLWQRNSVWLDCKLEISLLLTYRRIFYSPRRHENFIYIWDKIIYSFI